MLAMDRKFHQRQASDLRQVIAYLPVDPAALHPSCLVLSTALHFIVLLSGHHFNYLSSYMPQHPLKRNKKKI